MLIVEYLLYGCWPDDDPQGAGSWTYGAPTSIFRGHRRQRRSNRPRMTLSRAGGTSDGGIEAKNKSYPSGLLHRRGPQTSGDVGDVFVGRWEGHPANAGDHTARYVVGGTAMMVEHPYIAGVPPAGGSLMVMVAAGFMALSWCCWAERAMIGDKKAS